MGLIAWGAAVVLLILVGTPVAFVYWVRAPHGKLFQRTLVVLGAVVAALLVMGSLLPFALSSVVQ